MSQEIHKQWMAGGEQRKSLLNILIKANGDKAGLFSNSILFSPCFDNECLSIYDITYIYIYICIYAHVYVYMGISQNVGCSKVFEIQPFRGVFEHPPF